MKSCNLSATVSLLLPLEDRAGIGVEVVDGTAPLTHVQYSAKRFLFKFYGDETSFSGWSYSGIIQKKWVDFSFRWACGVKASPVNS